MKNNYQEMVKGLEKFNQWEKEFSKKLTINDRINQFIILYELKNHIPEARLERVNKNHLEHSYRSPKKFD